MGTPKPTHKAPTRGRRPPRRPACSTAASKRATPKPAGSELESSDGLKLTVTVVPLPDPASNPLRGQQLAVIVKLLRRAATEAGNARELDGAGSEGV